MGIVRGRKVEARRAHRPTGAPSLWRLAGGLHERIDERHGMLRMLAAALKPKEAARKLGAPNSARRDGDTSVGMCLFLIFCVLGRGGGGRPHLCLMAAMLCANAFASECSSPEGK